MLNIDLLKRKYKRLVTFDENKFTNELDLHSKRLAGVKDFNSYKSLIIYNHLNKNTLIYYLCFYYSLLDEKIKDFEAITGQNLIDEYFADKDRDLELSTNLRYTDILFIIVDQLDYKHDYLETLVKNLVDFRTSQGLRTVLLYQTVSQSITEASNIQAVETYFRNQNFLIVKGQQTTKQEDIVKKAKQQGRLLW